MENNIHIAKKTYIPLSELKRKQMVTMVKKKRWAWEVNYFTHAPACCWCLIFNEREPNWKKWFDCHFTEQIKTHEACSMPSHSKGDI